MQEEKAVTIHRWLQIYVSIVTTAVAITIAIIGYTVSQWHTEFIVAQDDIHSIKIDLVRKGDVDKFQDYRITKLEDSPTITDTP